MTKFFRVMAHDLTTVKFGFKTKKLVVDGFLTEWQIVLIVCGVWEEKKIFWHFN